MRSTLALLLACTVLSLAWRNDPGTPTPGSTIAPVGSIEGAIVKVGQYRPVTERVPAAGWSVLLGRDCALVAKAESDSEGVYRFDDLAPGEYVVQLSLDQPEGQGWELIRPSKWANNCRSEDIAVSVEAGEVASGPEFTVQVVEEVRGHFGKVFNDLDEDGERDPEEPGFSCPLRRQVGDVIWFEEIDLDGNFRDVRRSRPTDEEPLELTSCPAYPDAPPGHRVTAPRPGPCGRNGCVTRSGDQLFRCQDFGLHLVDKQGASFGGSIWWNASPVPPGLLVTAKIGDAACGEGYVWEHVDDRTVYEVIVRSEEARSGCGSEGREIRFSLDGRDIPVVGHWHAGQQWLDLVIGPPFAEFDAKLEVPRGSSSVGGLLQAYIGDVLCGEARGRGSMIAYTTFFTLVVLPDSLRPGCGRDGDTIRFLVDRQPLSQTATWSPGKHSLNLTTPLRRLPDTGSAGLSHDSDGLAPTAGFALLALALAFGLAALALRRRAEREE